MYLCICRAISEDDVREVGRTGVTEPKDLIDALGLNDYRCCGRCLRGVEEWVRLAREGAAEVARRVIPSPGRAPLNAPGLVQAEGRKPGRQSRR